MLRCALFALRTVPFRASYQIPAKVIKQDIRNYTAINATNHFFPANVNNHGNFLKNRHILQIANNLNPVPVRTVIKFSLKRGKRKTVKAVVKRFFRLHWGGWIRTKVGQPSIGGIGKVATAVSGDWEILKSDAFDKVKKVQSKNPEGVPLSSVKLCAPIHGMDKVLCIGLNYKDHCQEQNLSPPEVPIIFSKFSSTVVGPCDAVRLREVTKKVDWEVELTVVIGKPASDVKATDALDYVLGYTIAQDISARDWQKSRNGGQFLLGKSMDTFCPIGPCITTSDEIGDAQNLAIKCSVNGVLKQRSKTDQLIHKIPDVIERLSSVMTLLPGDIILTGTPGGVGMYRDPPEYLKPGDVIHSEIEKIGVLETRVEKF
ncbi:unnamed protein product, partial [Iphiclides podalirius]